VNGAQADHDEAGDDAAGNDQLLAQVYDQLRGIARSRLKNEAANHTLQATALVHEAWLKLCQRGSVMALDRPRFVMAAAEAMRRVLVDHSRAKDRAKRGGGVSRRSTTDLGDILDLARVQDPEQIVALDQAICRLGKEYPKSSDVVKLRFFAGLSVEETAACLGISERTVKREWKFARAWLFRVLS
jgi:RNA polymerase sigma factor (TIGR02999 family)